MQQKLSIIIPVFNEQDSIEELHSKLAAVCTGLKQTYEIIFIDDGSVDMSFELLQKIAAKDHNTKVIRLKRNYGQTAALQSGLLHSNGEILIFIDADLQNDPNDIPKLLDKMGDDIDVVSGWRKNRKDNFINRTLPSICANWLISQISGVKLHDYGCTLKAYKKNIFKDIKLFGEMHRFIPAYAALEGARIAEVIVTHHPRKTGKSKYGLSRTFKVILDLLVMRFLFKYAERPIHFFGGAGLVILFLSFISGVTAIILKIIGYATFIETPLPTLTALFLTIAILLMLMGIIAEMLLRKNNVDREESYKNRIKTTLNLNK